MEQVRNHRVVLSQHGGPEALHLLEEDLPEPGAGEVRVRVLAAGVSAFDLIYRRWSRLPGSPRVPFTLGEDVVGTVDVLGKGVSSLELGQMVAGGTWALGVGGGYAEHVCLSERELVPVPTGLDPAEAVSLVVNFLTAHLHLHHIAEARSGERVLVHGAAGGVGTALLQLGKLAGLEMYGTASKHNHDLVTALGATPIDYRSEDFVERIHSLTGDGVDVVVDLANRPSSKSVSQPTTKTTTAVRNESAAIAMANNTATRTRLAVRTSAITAFISEISSSERTSFIWSH